MTRRSSAKFIIGFLIPTLLSASVAPSIEQLRELGEKQFRSGQFSQAAETYQRARAAARQASQRKFETIFLGNVMSCRFALLQYRAAAEAYEEARAIAQADHDNESLAVLATNMSSLYAHIGDFPSAARHSQEARTWFKGVPNSKYWPIFLLQEATVRSALGDSAGALDGFTRVAAEAAKSGDQRLEARAWELAGSEHAKRSQWSEAEGAMQRARQLQIAKNGETGPDWERRWGLIRQGQKQPAEALAAFDRAIEKARRLPNGIPSWLLSYHKGTVLAAQSTEKALPVLESAVAEAMRWRRTVLPAVRTGDQTDAGLNQLYDAYLETGYREYERTHDARLLTRLFRAVEETRALAVQNVLTPELRWQNRVPAKYWEQAAELRHLYGEAAVKSTAASRTRIRMLEGNLMEWERHAGLELPRPTSGSTHTASNGLAGELYLSFHFADHQSLLFARTAGSLAVQPLPARAHLQSDLKRWRAALQENSPQSRELGRHISDELFGRLPGHLWQCERWALALDGDLFELPFAALPDEKGRYLIEKHSLRVIPGPSRANRAAKPSSFMLALGDPVFHPADPRWRLGKKDERPAALPLALPRLPGTAREVGSFRKVWKGEMLALTGNEVSLQSLTQVLQRKPAVVHVATHIVPVSELDEVALIALGAGSGSTLEFLTSTDVANLAAPGSLIVMNGCHSGAGRTLPGAGWIGLTRAWLLAGAQAVVASYWPTTDDDGALFRQFYLSYQQNFQLGARPAADALRAAQLSMLRAPDWRAEPKYWAAYFVTERN